MLPLIWPSHCWLSLWEENKNTRETDLLLKVTNGQERAVNSLGRGHKGSLSDHPFVLTDKS